MMGLRGKIRALARYIDFNLVIFRLRWKASWFPNLVSLLPESKIKRAILLAVCQNINTVFTGDCSSLREDECFSTRMRCMKYASKKKQPQHYNRWRLETTNNTVPLFSADVSNVRKSNKRTVKGLWRELFKFRLKCLPYPPVLMFRSRRASRSETSCDTTLSLPLRKIFKQR